MVGVGRRGRLRARTGRRSAGSAALLAHPRSREQLDLAARLRRPGRGDPRDLRDPARRAVVERLVSGRRAGRRRLRRPADAGGRRRKARHGRDAAVQRRPLRPAALALDPGRARARSSSSPTWTRSSAAFPAHRPTSVVRHDLAYPAMLTFLPAGLLGLVLASLIAAYMSTISTHLNWGSSYVVNDFYKRFVAPAASEERAGAGRPLRDGRADGRRGRALAAAGERPAGVSDPAPDRRRHRSAVHPALVLVADQRGERARSR